MEVNENFLEDLGWYFDHCEKEGLCYVDCSGDKIYIFYEDDPGCYILEDENEDFGDFYSAEEIYEFVKSWENEN